MLLPPQPSPYFSATLQDLYSKCREVFRKLRAEDKMLKKHRLYYDLQSILYSLGELENVDEVGARSCPDSMAVLMAHCPPIQGQAYKVVMPADGLNQTLFSGAQQVEVRITKVTDNFQLTLNDFAGVNADLTKNDHSLLQFIDIATSQHPYFHE